VKKTPALSKHAPKRATQSRNVRHVVGSLLTKKRIPMTETKRQHAKIKHTIAEHLIPETAEFGEVFCARDTGAVWYATRSGVVVNLTAILNAETVHAPVRHGRDGIDGRDGAKGERGDRGSAGESIVGPQGMKGDSVIGPQGASIKGDRGERGPCGPDTAEAIAASVAAVAALRSEVSRLNATVQGLIDANKQAGDYIEYLRAKKRKA
jgi:hypothetical protein